MQSTALSRFIAASGLVNLADGIAVVAWAWLASLVTRDPLLVALIPVTLRLPWVLFTIPAGILMDRQDRRLLLIWMDGLRFGAFALLAIVLTIALPLPPPPKAGVDQTGLFILITVAAGLVGTAEVLRDNAAQTMLPSIVPHAELERANGRLWSVELVGNTLLGPAIGAFLIAYAVSAPFAANAVAYLGAFFLLLTLRGQFRPERTAKGNWRQEMMEGVRFLWAAPLLIALALITGFSNLFYEMVMIGLVLHVQENLSLTAEIYGLILAGGALGGILGGWYGDRIVQWLGPLPSAIWMLFLSVPAFATVSVAPGSISLTLVWMMFNFTALIWNTVAVSYRQRMIPDALLGRVNSLYRLFAWGMMPVGLFLSGWIVRVADGPLPRDMALIVPFVIAAIGSAIVALWGGHALRRHWPS